MMTDPKAAMALDSRQPETADQPDPGEGEGSTGNSFFIPKDVVASTGYKEGDKTITLNVLGSDEDGDLEVSGPDSGGGNSGDWRSELKSGLEKAGNEGGQ